MSKERVKETIVVLRVVSPLIFVGLEIRQSTAAARGQTRQELEAMDQEWLTLVTADPEYSDLWYRAWAIGQDIAKKDSWTRPRCAATGSETSERSWARNNSRPGGSQKAGETLSTRHLWGSLRSRPTGPIDQGTLHPTTVGSSCAAAMLFPNCKVRAEQLRPLSQSASTAVPCQRAALSKRTGWRGSA